MIFDLSIFDNIEEIGQGDLADNENNLSGENLYNFNDYFDTANESNLLANEVPVSNANHFGIPDFDDWYQAEHGTPIPDATVWHEQTTPFTCGIVSSEMVMKMFGLEISEAQLTYEATTEGLLTDNGMNIEGIQQLLENHEIDTHIGSGDISDLAQELDAGHKIVIPLDSGEIWGKDSQWEDLFNERADHAVVLTGIDTDSIPPKVFLNDPGHPNGEAMEVDLALFIDAWNDSGNQFIATDTSPLVS